MVSIEILGIIDSNLAIYDGDGKKVYDLLQDAITRREQVTISFIGMKRCSIQFLNAFIGKIYLLNDALLVDKLVEYYFSGLDNVLPNKIKEVIDNAILQKK